ncbi:MAG: hypothetical protein JXR25_15695 [Pontiellaceae bacterium]|nr:hypothetical protein [Pontiellaceae bacterium]
MRQIRSVQQTLFNLAPVFPEQARRFIDGSSTHARRTLVPLHLLSGSPHILRHNDLLKQRRISRSGTHPGASRQR